MVSMSATGDRSNGEETASQRSGSQSGPMSQTSSQKSDVKLLEKRRRSAAEDNEEGDLLGQRRSIQEGIFACMHTLVRQSALSSWKFAIIKMILEGLTGFIVVFNPSIHAWDMDTNNPVWQIVRWTVWRSPVMRLYTYRTYVTLMYAMVIAVALAVLGLVWLTLAMRKAEQSKWLLKAAMVLHIAYDVMFVMFYVSFFDYFVFLCNCNFSKSVKDHVYFQGVMCLEMPHILHMTVAVLAALVFFIVTALMLVASCQLNPISQGYLASPHAITRLKILFAKAAFVIASDDLQSWPRVQAVLLVVAVSAICWWNFRAMPFYRVPINAVWTGMWCGILYTSVLLAMSEFGKNQSDAHQRQLTMNVLYGIFPVIAGGIAVCWVHCWWAMRPAKKFRNLDPAVKIRSIYKFESEYEVERLSRVMRVFSIDGDVEEDGAVLGEAIIKAGMSVFPNSAHLLILYANFLLEVRKDGPAARTQLQLAAKHAPTLVERYQVFCTSEASKRLKDSQDGGMDLQAYIEFRRNFRAVLRVHKEMLALQTELWTLCTRSTLRVSEADAALNALDAATARANQVYKKVLERYPTNGKLLRCYGKFLEDGKHDIAAAARVYAEANRHGGSDAIMSLDLSGIQGATGKPEFLTSLSLADDAVIVINAEGVIMMASQAVQPLFGYPKAELEGANVALLMPQPFSQRHAGYLTRYVRGGEPHILDSVREVVALHKERFVFPVMLCVTKMSGTGADSIFLGVVRPLPSSTRNIRAWVAPNGVFLCGDQQFASLVGVGEGELIGRSLLSLCASPATDVERLLELGRDSSAEELAAGAVSMDLQLRHRYLGPVSVHITMGFAGTDTQRILVLSCQRTDGAHGSILVVDTHGRLRFAAAEVAAMLSYPAKKLVGMRLGQLLPPPFDTLHTKWLREPPHTVAPTGCRAGCAVSLVSSSGSSVPVSIRVEAAASEAATDASSLYVVKVEKVSPKEVLDEKQVVLTADLTGRVRSVSKPESAVFGFPASEFVGANLCDSVDIFEEWRANNGDSHLQLLMLALLAKEQDMPGASWRVRVHTPRRADSNVPHLPTVPGAQPAAGGGARALAAKGVSTCLQVELVEAGHGAQATEGSGPAEDEDGAMLVHIVLWRRDLLTGVVELDENLVIRRASPMTGLISGLPASAMVKKPLHRFLDIPPEASSWEALVASQAQGGAGSKQRSALKATGSQAVVSHPMTFIGPHPDMGNMRIVVQGVSALAPGTGRPKLIATLHPDTAFAGAHANLMRVLHLENVAAEAAGGRGAGGHGHAEEGEGEGAERPQRARPKVRSGDGEGGSAGRRSVSPAGPAEDSGAEGGSDELDGGASDGSSGRRRRSSSGAVGAAAIEADAQEQADLHRTAASKSDFVAQWVRTLTHESSGGLGGGRGSRRRPASGGPAATGPAGQRPYDGTKARSGRTAGAGGLATVAEGEALEQAQAPELAETAAALQKRASSYFLRGDSAVGGGAGGDASRSAVSTPEAQLGARPGSGDKGGGEGGRDGGDGGGAESRKSSGLGPETGEKWEKGSEGGESSADGSQAASGITSVTDAHSCAEYVVDSRRGRLLRSLQKLMCGPALTAPLDRLRLHSYALLAIMLLTHIVCYIVVKKILEAEHTNVYLVNGQALAMDRSQLIAVRAMAGAFCARPGVAPVSVCASNMAFTLGKLATNVELMEQHHQGVFLGFSRSRTKRLTPRVYEVWTAPSLAMQFFMDTQPPATAADRAGAWELGNRYIAAAREALFWLPQLRDKYTLHRTYQFLVANGLGPLFTGYAISLDLLMDAAWRSVDDLRRALLILLAVEALFIQIACTMYEWSLVQRVEGARLAGVVAMLGLPGPVLRGLASRETRLLEGSDDDEADDGSVGGEEEAKEREQREKEKERAGPQGGPAVPGVAGAGAGEKGQRGEGGSRVLAVARPQPGDPEATAAAAALVSTAAAAKVPAEGDGEGAAGAAGRTSGRIAAAWGRGRRGSKQGASLMRINGKDLLPSYATVTRFMLPFLLWNAAVICIYVVSVVKLKGMQGPLASLNMASHVIYRYTRIRAIALGFVVADDTASKALMRASLSDELRVFESEYDALMYGGTPLAQFEVVFNHPVPASTFASTSFATEFFSSKRCFLYNQAECKPPGDPYYEVTHNGLDVMVRRMLSEMSLLVADDDEDAVYNSTRYTYMARVGGYDLYEGLQQAAQLFVDYSIGRYNAVAQLHTVLLVVTVFLAAAYLVGVLWPHLARMRADAARCSALLSHVPPEMDVRAHVRAVLRRAGQGAGGARRAKAARGRAAASGEGPMVVADGGSEAAAGM